MTDTTISLSLKDNSKTFEIPADLQKPTVLYFMRAANCAQCNRHAREINQLQSELEAKSMEAIIIVPENVQTADKVKARNKLTIPVLSGEGSAHALAGLDKKFLGLIQQSGTVVVDASGVVLYKRIATNPEESFKIKEFKEYLETV
jgi:peroxiredoxin